MKVLLASNGPATVAERTVIARRQVAFLQELDALGVRTTTVLFGDRAGLADDFARAKTDVRVIPVPLDPSAASLPRLPFAALRLREAIAEVRPDVVEASEPMVAIAAGLSVLGWRGKPAVIYRREHGGGRFRIVLAGRLAARLTDRMIVSSSPLRAVAVRTDGADPDLVDVATTGTVEPRVVDAEEIRTARRSLGISDSARVVAVVARLRREKGIDVVIRAVDRLAGVDDLHLIIAGSGPREAELRELSGRSGVPVHFLGNRDDVAVWYALADVVAIPSRLESFGRVTLEAMAAGRPIVASRVGGLQEAFTDGVNALLVPPEDEAALAAALRTLLCDGELARRLAEAARERFRSRYTMKHMAISRRDAWVRAAAARGVR